MKKILIIIILIIIAGFAYYALSPLLTNVSVDDPLPPSFTDAEKQMMESEGGVEDLSEEEREEMERQMTDANTTEVIVMEDGAIDPEEEREPSVVMDTVGHPASGTVRVIESSEGTFVRFEDFKTINGPRLHVYLAKDLDAEEFIDLGPIRGTEGNINYRVPDDVDISEYQYVMHWCVPFRVLFNFARI